MLKYVLVVVLHHERILNNPQRISKNEPSVGQYIWRKNKFPAKSKDWEKTEKIMPMIHSIFVLLIILMEMF